MNKHGVKVKLVLQLVQEIYSNEPRYLEDDDALIKIDPSCNGYKIYVSNALDEDPEKPFLSSKLHGVIDRFVHVVSITVVLPETDLGEFRAAFFCLAHICRQICI